MKYCMAILLALISFNTYAGLTKWVDADGKVHYTDGPAPDNVKAETLHISSSPRSPNAASSPAAASSAPSAPKTIYEKEADLKKEHKAKEEAAQKAAKEQEDANNKKQACEQARIQLSTLQNSPRVSVYDAKGERTVMDDAARQKSMDDARGIVSKFCN